MKVEKIKFEEFKKSVDKIYNPDKYWMVLECLLGFNPIKKTEYTMLDCMNDSVFIPDNVIDKLVFNTYETKDAKFINSFYEHLL